MIYFDNNATTPLHPDVIEEMRPFLSEIFGNPSSAHEIGNRAKVAVDRARSRAAKALGAASSEIVFTGCGSESNNQAILGTILAKLESGKNIVYSAVEHPAVQTTIKWACDKFDYEPRCAPIEVVAGRISAEPFTKLIDENTVLVSVMSANNETGLILPVAEIFAAAKSVGAMRHTDAVQAVGKIPFKPADVDADLASFTAHKFHGPKGSGGLYIRRGVKIEPLIHGGPQENVRRAGTENVANIVGLGKAMELADSDSAAAMARIRDYFESRLQDVLGDRAVINFKDLKRTPNTSSVRFPGLDGNVLLIKLDRRGVCVSTGAACSSGSLSASAGLLAMGLSDAQASATLRFSFSKFNTPEEVDQTVAILDEAARPGKRRR